MGKKRRKRRKRDISVENVAVALQQLNVTKIKRSWRHNKSELGDICIQMGRKNNLENRKSVEYIIRQKSKGKIVKRSPKPKYRREEYGDTFKLRRNRISLRVSTDMDDKQRTETDTSGKKNIIGKHSKK